MKRSNLLGSIALASLIASSASFAVPAGFYVGGGLGLSYVDGNDSPLFSTEGWQGYTKTVNTRGLGWSIFGGYNFNEYFSAELGYKVYAKLKDESFYLNDDMSFFTSRENSLGAISLVGKAGLPVGESGFNVYALAGVAQVQERLTSKHICSKVGNSLRPKYGVGAGYAFSDKISTNLELTRVNGVNRNSTWSIKHADALMLNFVYHID